MFKLYNSLRNDNPIMGDCFLMWNRYLIKEHDGWTSINRTMGMKVTNLKLKDDYVVKKGKYVFHVLL